MSEKELQEVVAVMVVERDVGVTTYGIGSKAHIPLTWAKGMIGVLPVFDSIEAAAEYTDGKSQLLKCTIEVSK